MRSQAEAIGVGACECQDREKGRKSEERGQPVLKYPETRPTYYSYASVHTPLVLSFDLLHAAAIRPTQGQTSPKFSMSHSAIAWNRSHSETDHIVLQLSTAERQSIKLQPKCGRSMLFSSRLWRRRTIAFQPSKRSTGES